MRRVANDDHCLFVPGGHVGQVVRVVAGQFELATFNQVDRWTSVVGKQLNQLRPPGVQCGRGPFRGADLVARHVGKPHCAAVSVEVVAKERALVEDQVPPLWISRQSRVGRVAAEVRQADVSATGRARVDEPSDERMHAISPNQEIAVSRGAIGEARPQKLAHVSPSIRAGRLLQATRRAQMVVEALDLTVDRRGFLSMP